MARSGLTPKRERFAREVASGKQKADAYRAAFSAERMSAEAIRVEAARLMANPSVALRVQALTERAAERAGITLESHLRDLMTLRNLAAKEKQMSAAISAEIARGKAAGVVAPEKREHTGAGGAPIAVTSVSPEEYRRIAAEVAAKT